MTREEQRAFFYDQGYLIVEGVVSADELGACEAEIRNLHALAAELVEQGDARAGHFQREPYAKDKRQEGLPVLRKIEQTRDFSEVFKNLAAHPKLVPVVQNLIGPDLLLFRSTLMLKPAFHGSSHGFHQDSAYWPMEPPALVTVSIALTDSNSENGCIQVIPESHKWGMQKWGHIARPQDAALTDKKNLATAIEVPLKAGTALLFHSLCVPRIRAESLASSQAHRALCVFSADRALHGARHGLIAHVSGDRRVGRQRGIDDGGRTRGMMNATFLQRLGG